MKQKLVVLIPIAVIAIILSAIIVKLFMIDGEKTPPFLHIITPENSVSIKQGESFLVEGKTNPYGGLVFIIKTGNTNEPISGWNPIELKVDNPEGGFTQNITVPDDIAPGNYKLIVSLGDLSDTRVVSIIDDIPPPPPSNTTPYFVYEGNRVSTIIAKMGQQMTIQVIDEDGDLNGVWNETFPGGVANHTFTLPAANITGDIIINATDLAGHRSALLVQRGDDDTERPVFYVNNTVQANGASVIFNNKNPQKIEAKDNKSIRKIGGKVVDTSKYEYSTQELESLPEGKNRLVAYDRAGNSASITLIRDLKPPTISKGNSFYMEPDSREKIVFSDDNGLFQVAGTSVVGKEYELIIDSGNLKEGENSFDAYDMAGNESTLIITKGEPLGARIVSPTVSPYITKSDNVRISVEVKGGQGQRFIVINNDSTAIEPGAKTASANFRLQDGSNVLAIFARDEVTTLKLSPIEVIKDTKPPVISSVDGDPVVDRIWILKKAGEDSHKISIKDDSGIDKVTINGNNVKVETEADKTSTVSISDKNLKNTGNEIVILDKVGNELKKSIEILDGGIDPKFILENIKKLITAREYTRAEELVKSYEKIQYGPTADLLRGMINYGRGQYDKSIEDLNKAYQLRERYDKESLNAEYNLLYLGLAYYEQGKSKNNVDSSNKALLSLGRLNNPDVKNRAPEIYEKARNTMNSIEEAQKGRSR